MKKLHVLTIAVLLGLAAVFGLLAATKTARVAAGTQAQVADGSLAARTRKLDQAERALALALRDRPPALPPARAAAPQQVIVRRPAPLIVIKNHGSGEDDVEHEAEREEDGGDD